MATSRGETIVKKYSNRRLYDTGDSRYITLEELSGKIRDGRDVVVIDAKSGDDLTQATLAQIILESRRAARLLPVPLLMRLIRMGDDSLSEFFSNYMSWALDIYLQAKRNAEALSPFNPFATLPFQGANALSQLFAQAPWIPANRKSAAAKPPASTHADIEADPPDPDPVEAADHTAEDIAELRREIQALKQALRGAE